MYGWIFSCKRKLGQLYQYRPLVLTNWIGWTDVSVQILSRWKQRFTAAGSIPGDMKKVLQSFLSRVTSLISFVMFTNLPATGGTRRKSKILFKRQKAVIVAEKERKRVCVYVCVCVCVCVCGWWHLAQSQNTRCGAHIQRHNTNTSRLCRHYNADLWGKQTHSLSPVGGVQVARSNESLPGCHVLKSITTHLGLSWQIMTGIISTWQNNNWITMHQEAIRGRLGFQCCSLPL